MKITPELLLLKKYLHVMMVQYNIIDISFEGTDETEINKTNQMHNVKRMRYKFLFHSII